MTQVYVYVEGNNKFGINSEDIIDQDLLDEDGYIKDVVTLKIFEKIKSIITNQQKETEVKFKFPARDFTGTTIDSYSFKSEIQNRIDYCKVYTIDEHSYKTSLNKLKDFLVLNPVEKRMFNQNLDTYNDLDYARVLHGDLTRWVPHIASGIGFGTSPEGLSAFVIIYTFDGLVIINPRNDDIYEKIDASQWELYYAVI